ncbi:Cupin domain-containing protein [Dyadobacter soli]|uniref:Cupin domain-containing protein n=1 Tax=Dyadobacter soli TaxID=659014 RepID=A0A1G7M2R8_9BACT|nr:cupin domain-containing protein [Dyadobacter soli]SDF55469.1 Cupin domain-containing protein [Dyadobacter soli]
MERRSFLQLPVIAPALTSFLNLWPDNPTNGQPKDGILVRAGEDRSGKPFKWLDATFTVKVSGKDTNGRCVIFDTLRPEKVGPPLHLHTDCDEWFFVMEGEFKFQVNQEITTLKAGDSLMVLQDTPHAFVKTSEGMARLIVMHQPAGQMEEYFRTVIQQADQTIEGRRTLAEKHGMRIVGPPLKAS